MKTLLKITICLGLTIFVASASDPLTIPQMLLGFALGLVMMIIPTIILVDKNTIKRYLLFVNQYGQHKKVRVDNCIGKFIAICRYRINGYILDTEIVYEKER